MNEKHTLTHHGILGQKWGVRRYQNRDGSLTAAGRAHIGAGGLDHDRELKNRQKNKLLGKSKDGYHESSKPEGTRSAEETKEKLKKAAKIGATAVVAGLAVYGAYKGSQYLKSEAGKKILQQGEAAMRPYLNAAEKYAYKKETADINAKDKERILRGITAETRRTGNNSNFYNNKISKLQSDISSLRQERDVAAKTENDAVNRARSIYRDSNKMAEEVSKSAVKSAKYLWNEHKKKKKH